MSMMNTTAADSIKSLELDLNNFRADLKQVNSSMKARVSGLTFNSSSNSSTANHLVESNLGRNFYDFSKKKESLDKVGTDRCLATETLSLAPNG